MNDTAGLVARALALHDRNFNCAQCVVCALAPRLGADEDVCFRASEGLGRGMGGMSETCGAVSGGAMAIGLATSNGAADPTSKELTYRYARRLVEAFRAKNGSTICADLKGERTGAPLRSCSGCIEDGVALAAGLLDELRAHAR